MTIHSIKNDLVREARKLRSAQYRSDSGKCIAIGRVAVFWALSGRYSKLGVVLFNEDKTDRQHIATLRDGSVQCWPTSQGVLRKIVQSGRDFHMVGIVGNRKLDETQRSERLFAVLLDNLCDDGNIGSILRSALAFRVDEMILIGTTDGFSRTAISASRGACFNIPIVHFFTREKALEYIEEKKYSVVASQPRAGKHNHDNLSAQNIALALGNEGQGLSKEILDISKGFVRIPMEPRIESLNVSVAGGILLHQMYCQQARWEFPDEN